MQEIQNFNKILDVFKIDATCIDFQKNNNFYFYDLKLNNSTTVKNIVKFSDEISLSLLATGKPNIKAIHDKGIVRLEFSNKDKKQINLFEKLCRLNLSGQIPCYLGSSVDGSDVCMDLSKNPHLLIAGTTGSGKSVLLHNIIGNILYHNSATLFLIDPKNIEFSDYEGKSDDVVVGYSYDAAISTIDIVISEMEERFRLLRNNLNPNSLKNIVLIIDEFSDLILQDSTGDLLNKLIKLSQKCRAAKIHIILATQRPTANIVNGAIKSNFPARISCKVSSHIDSKVILDSIGAENLTGYGDAYLKDNFRNMERFQTAYTTSEDVINYCFL